MKKRSIALCVVMILMVQFVFCEKKGKANQKNKETVVTAVDNLETDNAKNKENTAVVAAPVVEDNIRVEVRFKDCKGLSQNEEIELKMLVKQKLQNNLKNYLRYEVFDAENERIMKDLARESEANARDSKYAIELGKIRSPNYALVAAIIKSNGNYSLHVSFTEIKTNLVKASVSSMGYSDSKYIYNSTGAVDEITLSLAEKMNVLLSETEKYELKKGPLALTVAQTAFFNEKTKIEGDKKIQDNKKQIEKLKRSSDAESMLELAMLESQNRIIEERQKLNEENLLEAKKQQKLAEETKKKLKERSVDLVIRAEQLAEKNQKKIEKLQKEIIENLSVEEKLQLIQSRYKAVMDIRGNVETQLEDLHEKMIKERDSAEAEIKGKPWLDIELVGKQPTSAAKKRRENQLVQKYEEITQRFLDDSIAIYNTTLPSQNVLITNNNKDLTSLRTENRVLSSLGNKLKVTYGYYNQKAQGWQMSIDYEVSPGIYFRKKTILKYETLTGKKAPDLARELNDAKIMDYQNTIDFYDFLFTQRIPVVYLEVFYNITQADSKEGSGNYRYNFIKYHIVDVETGAILDKLNFTNEYVDCKVSPVVKMRELGGAYEAEKKLLNYFKQLISKGNSYEEAKIVCDELLKLIQEGASFEEAKKLWEQLISKGKSYEEVKIVCDELLKLIQEGASFEEAKELWEQLISDGNSYEEAKIICDEILKNMQKRMSFEKAKKLWEIKEAYSFINPDIIFTGRYGNNWNMNIEILDGDSSDFTAYFSFGINNGYYLKGYVDENGKIVTYYAPLELVKDTLIIKKERIPRSTLPIGFEGFAERTTDGRVYWEGKLIDSQTLRRFDSFSGVWERKSNENETKKGSMKYIVNGIEVGTTTLWKALFFQSPVGLLTIGIIIGVIIQLGVM
ncbi:MAG: hypothetical protein MJ188_08635 [Treponema sp.]|nr:hypothetical protein [Treponema sp.]